MNFLETISSHQLFPLGSFIVGIIVAIFIFKKSQKKKTLKYTYKSYNLIKDHTSKFSDLNITYKGEEVKNFTVTKILFWNAGKKTIDGTDITSVEPLIIESKDETKFLESRLIASNNSANQIKIKALSENKIMLAFDYLDYLDGGAINIIHSGQSSDDIKLVGKIKGIKKLQKASIPKAPNQVHFFVPIPIHKDIRTKNPNKRRLIYGLSHISNGGIYMILMAIFLLLEKYGVIKDSETSLLKDGGIWFVLIPGLLIIANGLFILTKRLPKGLDVYEDLN